MTDIAELFARDPLLLSRETDIPELVKVYRDKRYQFNMGDKLAGATKKVVGPKINNLDDMLEEI